VAEIIGTIPEYPNDSGAGGAGAGLTRDGVYDPRRPEDRSGRAEIVAYGAGPAVRYGLISQRNPEYRTSTWRRCRAFYKGGSALLEDMPLLCEVFPKHLVERGDVYNERCRRAFYLNYAGPIIDWYVAGLASDPVRLGVENEEGETEEDAPDLVTPDEYWEEFFKDVSKPGGEACTFQQHMLEQLRTALQCRRVWTLVDLPEMRDPDAPPATNLAEQMQRGELDAYLVHVEPEEVIDWEADDSGELMWAIRWTREVPRGDWRSSRTEIVERFMVYDRASWERYEIRYPAKDKKPDQEANVYLVGKGSHSFPRVPLVPFVLPEGLWAMGKLESPARAHFNKRNALDWAEHKSLLPLLYEFLGPEDMAGSTDSGDAADPNRAVVQPRGQGFVQIRGEKDKAEYVGPDAGPYTTALASTHDLRDEMHRVTHQMALAVNNTGASLGRSAESKGQDKEDRTVVLEEFGRILRSFALRVIETVTQGRGDKDIDWCAEGWESFDLDSLGDVIDQAVALSTVEIPSPTFKRMHAKDICIKVLGEKATPEVVAKIDDELSKAFTQDSMVQDANAEANVAMASAAVDGAGEVDDEGEPVAPPAKAKPGKLAFKSS
jgi:hypothetical protein